MGGQAHGPSFPACSDSLRLGRPRCSTSQISLGMPACPNAACTATSTCWKQYCSCAGSLPWSPNLAQREVRAPKIVLTDPKLTGDPQVTA